MRPAGRSHASSRGGPAGRDPELHQRLSRALAAKLQDAIGAARFAPDGRLESWADALVPGVDGALLDGAARDLCLAGLRRPASPTALAVNSFLNWRLRPGGLELAGEGGFRELHFGARCPTGVRGTPPLLDVVAIGAGTVVAVTAQGADYLGAGRGAGDLAPAYDHLPLAGDLRSWKDALPAPRGCAGPFRHLDTTALFKKAAGLARTFPGRRLRLLYLFLEPTDAAAHPAFAAHRAELERLELLTRGSAVAFSSQCFGELWTAWSLHDEPPWLRGLAAGLLARYAVVAAGR